MIARKVSSKIKAYSKQYPVILITGPRQSGKTTLVKSLFPKKLYVNLEDISKREFASNDPKGFLLQKKGGLIIDEVQRVPQLMSYIQVIVDEQQTPGQFIITGSQNILLMQSISQSLSGRVAIVNLLPFSIEELRAAKIDYKKADSYMIKGFYPRIYDKSLSAKGYYANYMQTYIERDVRLIKNISDLNAFQTFVKLCAGRVGQLLNLSSLSESCGISHNTAKEWISVLEASYIIFLVRPYYKNYNKRLVKMPKLYFYDVGLLNFLLGIESENQYRSHYHRGSIFENLIILEIKKHFLNLCLLKNIYFWRDKHGREIDCLFENANSITSIEIKSGETVNEDYFKELKYFAKLSSDTKHKLCLIYGGGEKQKRSYASVFGWRFINALFEK